MLYTIKNSLLQVTIDSKGAEIKNIKYLEQQRLHDSNPKYWNRSAPILFPNIGKLKNNSTNIFGKNFNLPKHGFLRDQKMEVVYQKDNAISFILKENAETLSVYPFSFEILIKYVLINNSIESTILIKNTSNVNMPFNLGLHPAFKVPLHNDKFEDYTLEFSNSKTYQTPTVNLDNGTIDFNTIYKTFNDLKFLPLNYSDYDNDAIILDDINFNNVKLLKNNKTYLSFTFNGFKTLGIWTPNNNTFANFICLEPWHGCADLSNHNGIFEDKKDIIVLKPNDSKLFSYSIELF